jgi:hypothetical protein
MPMTVNVAGQVGQIKLGQNKALWPLFETVINSIQSLEDTNTEQKQITIEALRNPNVQMRLNADGTKTEEPSRFEQFIVTDNGNGFNEANFKSFQEAYSQLKVKKGCKGIGRFLWLKAFEKVVISSTYQENGKWYLREFDFTLSGVSPDEAPRELKGNNYSNITRVTLTGFIARYRDAVSYSLESLAKKIIEHCLPYFIMKAVPAITLKDNRGESFSLNDYFDKVYKDSLNQDPIDLKGRHYQLYHMLLAQGADGHELHLCANNREVKSVDLYKKISNLEKGKKLPTEDGDVYYVGYLAGDYLDESINVERSEFEFEDLPVMSDNRGASEEEIVDAAVEMIKVYLKTDLDKVGTEKRKQIDRLVQATRPQYRLLLNKRPEVYDDIPSGLTDDKVDLELYRHQQLWEYETAKQRRDIEEKVKQNATTDSGFQPLFDEYCRNIHELSRAGLAEYVIRRKAIIDLLGKALEVEPSGSYSLESRIHSIICPMQVSSDEVKLDDMNLWLIDDRLAYHHYLASDKFLSKLPVLENGTQKRTDLIVFDAALSYTAETDDINSITIVELKRPQRDDHENDPVWQVLKYVRDIREGRIKKDNGRDFGDMSRVKFYCYVIGDLTPSMKDSAVGRGLRPTQDNEGYYGYNEGIGAYVEVISYNKLLKNARQRNQVFFDKLFDAKVEELVHPELAGQ